MKNDPTTHAPSAGEPSRTNERWTHTMQRFMLQNPFKDKRIDWLLVSMIAMLAGGGLLFLMCLRLIATSLS